MIVSSPSAARSPAQRSIALAATLIAALVVSALLWAQHAPRFFIFTQQSYGAFWSRNGWMLLHVVGGTIPVFLGPALLWSGLRQWRPRVHRWMGRTYLVTGAVGVGAGAALSIIAASPPRSLYVATFTLALAWFIAAGMAYRAIRNRQLAAHRQWVIRSYVLTLTFVICRIAMELPLAQQGGGMLTAIVWVSWVVPILLTEVALQWRCRGRLDPASTD
jgi:heme/copper-type cytochrome/quinol oxidase subunit 3